MKRISRRHLLLVTAGVVVSGVGCRNLSFKTHCNDDRGLSDAEEATRRLNKYVERSNRSHKYCTNCSQFTPGFNPEGCGSCRRNAGRINPRGGCKLWRG